VIQSLKPLTAGALVGVLIAALVLPVFAPPKASALPVFDAANFAQNSLTALRTAEAILQRIQMIRHQITQIEHMLTNLKELDKPTFRNIQFLLRRLTRLMEQRTRGLIYSQRQLSRTFQRIYPHSEPAEDLRKEEQERTETTVETLRAALLATQLQGEELVFSQAALAGMKSQALEAEGNLQALQSIALLEGYTAEEVSKLNQQLLVQTNMLAVAFAQYFATQAAAEETFRKALDETYIDVPPYATVTPLPVVPDGFGQTR